MSRWLVKQAARTIMAGGVIAYPTEAVYGLGCNPYDAQAVLHLLQIKKRDPAQGLILIGASMDDFMGLIQPLKQEVEARVSRTWPGPFTWLLPAADNCPLWLRGAHSTIAVRVTAHVQCRQLCQETGMALVSTSANLHGRPPAKNALQVRRQLGDKLDFILAGPTSGLKNPSEIRDAISGRQLR